MIPKDKRKGRSFHVVIGVAGEVLLFKEKGISHWEEAH